MKIANNWKEYELIDAGNGEKLEKWNNIILRRPEPQAMWNVKSYDEWNADLIYNRSDTGGGYWETKKKIKEDWTVSYNELTFKIKPTGFKHTGLFPEQAVNWDFMMNKIKNSNRKIKVLNLFAYTGGATMACSKAGADVVHVDASKGMVEWAKDNMKLCNLEENNIRFIVDDCLKFVLREARRGNKYDAIVMDPPTYGRGPSGELWKFEKMLSELIDACMQILSDKPLFFIVNAYATGISNIVLYNILKMNLEPVYKGKTTSDEIGLETSLNNLILPCGIYGRWESE